MPSNRPHQTERRPRPHKEQPLNCPRCHSVNTKFSYYNNYSLSQPRYFCKTCRRYWTEGGSLRNVPIGGDSRKNKRHSLTPKPISSNSTSSSQHSDLLPQATCSSLRNPNPKFHEEKGFILRSTQRTWVRLPLTSLQRLDCRIFRAIQSKLFMEQFKEK